MTGAGSRLRPVRLGPHRVPVYYAGGERIDTFRGEAAPVQGPEDWVGSVSPFPPALLPAGAPPETGISRLPDGRLLRAAVAADPVGWLGAERAASLAAAGLPAGETGLLVKLLDAGERLPVHCHPSRPFAAAHLGSPFGKTEGWIVLETAPDAAVWLGFREDVAPGRLQAWIDAGDADAMLAAMLQLPVAPGDVLLVPAGTPHAIGPGVLITELQEPTSVSILAEHRPFGLDAAQATLGLGWPVALGAFDLAAWGPDRVDRLRPAPSVLRAGPEGTIERLFAPETDPFFRAWRCRVDGPMDLPAGFAILVVVAGAATLRWADGEEPVAAGQTWLAPHGAGPIALEGRVEVLACLPPDPAGPGMPGLRPPGGVPSGPA